ncbi:hypothetical protein [Bosea minatitlanensis]|uniref:MAPEG family protein n=1 Tax=Bosea minatitlanensis TaxID=128782 RepID=A0ABW0F219_9HYPH|nr:hypothetical protein [Bosea minatitlanensis]MCT4491822.1 hypothetical protein [Bosea minatitlanensis]
MIAALAIILACALLNRLRGDDRWKPAWLPGRALFYVAPAIGTVALLAQPWPVALAFAGGYVFWAVWGWGHILMRVGGFRPDRPPDAVERALLRLPGSILPIFARMLFALPAAIAVAWLSGRPEFWIAAPSFAAVATFAYHVLFRPIGAYDWLRAEFAIGGLWGLLIIGA